MLLKSAYIGLLGSAQQQIFGAWFNWNFSSRGCEGKLEETLCYPVTKHIATYLDHPSVRAQIGVDPKITANFSSCNMDVNAAFNFNMDSFRPTQHYVAALLERGVHALIYVGKLDWGCDHVGNEAWTTALEWSGHQEFAAQPLREWNVDGKLAGSTRSAKGLTFVTVEGAGHMAPYDKLKETLEMVNKWLSERPF